MSLPPSCPAGLELAGVLATLLGRGLTTCASLLGIFCESNMGLGLGRAGHGGVVCPSKDLSVGGEEVSGRGERGQTPGHVGQEGEVRETLDVRLELFPHLGHPR